MNRDNKLISLAKLNRKIIYGNYNKKSLTFLKVLRVILKKQIKQLEVKQ
ncbi:hypothetical protein LCGC14_1544550 [marine sediment metagenome]|uniref:Uncharacterized protein n=1 Tax=marine sediment metagenome TaxID=412755 RepID=A0A0F9LSU2_9ZZZZ